MIAIVVIGTGFIAGISSSPESTRKSVDTFFRANNIADIEIIAPHGFTNNQLSDIRNSGEYTDKIEMFALDTPPVEEDGKTIINRFHAYDFTTATINNVIYDGPQTLGPNEIVVEKKCLAKHPLNSKVTLGVGGYNIEYTVVASIENSFYFASYPELSYYPTEPGGNVYHEITGIFYLKELLLPNPITFNPEPAPITKIWLSYDNDGSYFSSDYMKKFKGIAENFNILSIGEATDLAPGFLFTMPLEYNLGYILVSHITEQIQVIGYIFPLFFFLVTALVVLNTMTRLVEEERLSIGCCESLGISRNKVRTKYTSVAIVSGVIGSLIGILGLGWILPEIIHNVFVDMFSFPPKTDAAPFIFGTIMAVVLTLLMGLVSLFVVNLTLKEKPAYLLKHKPPRNGKTALLERTFIWKHLAFRFKSSIRNIFRYKKVLAMTLISTAGCTALILAGLGLLDTMAPDNYHGTNQGNDLTGSISTIAIFVIVIAGLLCAFVLFNLSNMNIDERKRELATLKVLGYKENEVSMYVFREVILLNFVGSLFGLPLGAGIVYLILYFMDAEVIGVFARIHWWSYFAAIGIVMGFTLLSCLILIPKIKKLDMLASLKTVE